MLSTENSPKFFGNRKKKKKDLHYLNYKATVVNEVWLYTLMDQKSPNINSYGQLTFQHIYQWGKENLFNKCYWKIFIFIKQTKNKTSPLTSYSYHL